MGTSYINSFKSAAQTTSLFSISRLLIAAFTLYTLLWTKYSGIYQHCEAGVSCLTSNITAIIPLTNTPEAQVYFPPPPGAKGPDDPYFAVCTLVKDRPLICGALVYLGR